MLHYKNEDNTRGAAWRGEAIGGVIHPRDIEAKWADVELTAIGLGRTVIVASGTGVIYEDGPITWVTDHWEISRVFRDKTAQEISDEQDAVAVARASGVFGKLHKLQLAGLFWLTNDVRTRHGAPALTVTQFLTNLDNFASQFDDEKFREKIKTLLD